MRFALAALGISVVAVSLWMRYLNRKAAAWPGIQGEVVESRLQPDAHDAGSSVRIAYAFSVGQHSFKSSRVSLSSVPDSLPAKERLVAAYPVGRRVTVYYDPANPQRSVIGRRQSSTWLAVVAAGAVFLAIGLLAP